MKASVFKLAVLSLSTIAMLTGCVSTTTIGAGAQRKQFVLVSQEHVEKKADKQLAKHLKRDKHEYNFNEARLARILNTLIPYADEYANGREIKWGVHVWRTKKFNAGAMANGMIMVSQKLAFNVDITDDELAYILSHEMAHILRQHHRELATWKYVLQPALIGAAFLTAGATATAGAVSHDVYNIGFRKQVERESDALGAEIYAKAGYDVKNAISLYKKMPAMMKEHHPILARIPTILSTHPSFKQRVKRLEQKQDYYTALQQAHVPKTSDNLIAWDFDKGLIKTDIKITVVNDENRAALKRAMEMNYGVALHPYVAPNIGVAEMKAEQAEKTKQAENSITAQVTTGDKDIEATKTHNLTDTLDAPKIESSTANKAIISKTPSKPLDELKAPNNANEKPTKSDLTVESNVELPNLNEYELIQAQQKYLTDSPARLGLVAYR